ncbi:MAG: methyl-accepting chemotaxis protein [Thermodesulfobacteriota bacterium]
MFLKKISLKWKLIFIAVSGPLVVSVIMSIIQINQIKEDNFEIIRERSRSIVMMAEATREEMASKLESGVIRNFDDIAKENIVEAVPVITAIEAAKKNARELNYEFRVPKFSPRNPENTPSDFEAEILNELKEKDLYDKYVITDKALHYFRPIKLTKDCLYCHGDPKGEKDPTGGIKEGWKAGEIHGSFEIISSLAPMKASIKAAIIKSFIVTFFIIIAAALFVWFFMKINILNPVKNIQSIIQKLGQGDLTGKITKTSDDELGIISDELLKTQNALIENISGLSKTSDIMKDAAKHLESLSSEMSVSSKDTTVQSESVAAASEELSSNMESVAAAVEETATNVSMVSDSAEEINQRISETAENTEKAKTISEEAVNQANEASIEVNKLGDAAKEIGKAIELITEISEQTNLLALNATIESARAGEAGKGFAVVADEIKKLAQQTYDASEEVKQKINDITSSAGSTVTQIKKISDVIVEVNDIVSGVTSSMEEQRASISEITENVSQASQGTSEVSANTAQASEASAEIAQSIAKVNSNAFDTNQKCDNVNENAKKLMEIAESINKMIKSYKV